MKIDEILLRSRSKLEFPQILTALSELAVSREAKMLCENLLPSSDLQEVERRQKETEDAVELLFTKGSPPMQGLHFIRPAVQRSRMKGSVLQGKELMQIGSFLGACERLRACLPEETSENEVYTLIEKIEPEERLQRDLNKAFLSEDELADDASPELFRIREGAKRSQKQIRQHLERILKASGEALQENIITLRQDRFVLPVKIEHRSKVPGIVHDTSQSGQTLFIEPLAVVEENNKLREWAIKENREIERILKVLSERVSAFAEPLLQNIIILAQVDFILAKAKLAKKMKARRPEMNDRGYINLKQARHPHIDSGVVVPIDIYVGGDFRTLVITGPNTGGKTVSLKTVGLLSLMAMSGLEVPVNGKAVLSVFDKVLVDVGDEQSIEQSLSTFSSHMKNIVAITDAVDDRSLVLSDELGSGTDPSEGAALAVSILEDFRAAGAVTIATTHYKELKVYALETAGVENASCEFDVESLKPTYRIMIGVPGTSHAFIISSKLGLREEIIARAQKELSVEHVHFEKVLSEIDKARIEAAELLENARKDEEAARKLKISIQAEEMKIRESKTAILQDLREENRRRLKSQTQEVDALIKDLRENAKNFDSVKDDFESLRHLLRNELNEIESDIGKETLGKISQPRKNQAENSKNWKIGDSAYAPTLGIEGKIESDPDNKGMVFLRSGQMQVSVPIDSLEEVPGNRKKKKMAKESGNRTETNTKKASSVRMNKKMYFNPEINIIGQTTEDGLRKLDSYLDDAVLAGAETVRIVHGKGTGALRKAVRDFLSSDKRVDSWKQAAFGEGDAGVTIAEVR